VPIGRPVANTALHILDPRGRPVPLGVVGELHIGGVQVGDGYLNQPALTSERFVWLDIAGTAQRLYKTGDRARWLADGNIAYLGRFDHQIKLRGMRVELGEIEKQARLVDGVRDAVVIADGEGMQQRLLCYVVPDALAQGEAVLDALRAALARALPSHMIPAAISVIAELPISVNGKVDFQALPKPLRQAAPPGSAALPLGATAQRLGRIWSAQLDIAQEQIGIHTSFFELGGNSLAIVAVQAAISEQLGCQIAVADLFRYPTLADLSRFIDGAATPVARRDAGFASAKERMAKARASRPVRRP